MHWRVAAEDSNADGGGLYPEQVKNRPFEFPEPLMGWRKIERRGALDLDLVSLFPKETWKNRPSGLRPDLVQLLSDLKL
jgi:hypothetical protein